MKRFFYKSFIYRVTLQADLFGFIFQSLKIIKAENNAIAISTEAPITFP